MKVPVIKRILDAQERIADELKQLFDEKGILVINLMSSPGAGKTSILEKTIEALKDKLRLAVIEGDVQTSLDAERIARYGILTVQINTYGACHIDGNMVKEALPDLNLDEIDILFVENVGNLVCPAEFKVGEDYKVMILSVPEGDDKPAKYPLMFRESSVLLINKIDLLPFLECDLEKINKEALKVNPHLKNFPVSAKTGEGLEGWYDWLIEAFKAKNHEKKN